jgi:hypothetical protein
MIVPFVLTIIFFLIAFLFYKKEVKVHTYYIEKKIENYYPYALAFSVWTWYLYFSYEGK